jgi:hypothetical protein
VLRRSRAVWLATPWLIGVPVAVGLAISLARVLESPWPDLGWAVAVSSDAGSFLLGHAPYGNPVHSYTGQLYTPFFPFAISVIDRVVFWEGWPLFLNILATVAGIGLVAWMALPDAGLGESRAARVLRVGGAIGIGALGWSLLFGLEANIVFQGRADHLAWVLALAGLIAWPRAVRGSRRAAIASCALLTLAFWTKQSTLVAVVAAVVWSLAAMRGGGLGKRRLLELLLALVVVNGLIFGLLELTSDGWQRYIEFQLPGNYARPTSPGEALSELVRHGGLALLATAAMWVTVAVTLRGRVTATLGRERAEATAALAVLIPVAIVGAVYFRGLQGAEDNQFLGVLWTLALLTGAAWRCTGATREGQLAASAVVAVLAASTFLPAHSPLSLRRNAWIPKADVATVPADVRAFARSHDVYNAFYSDLGVHDRRRVYQHYQALQDLLWGGRQPGRLLQDILGRRIEYVYEIPVGLDSAGGRWEQNWFWKLDQVIALKYARAAGTPLLIGASGAPEHAWQRRPGPDPAPWIDRCFGPYVLAGRSFRIAQGGGLWCLPRRGGQTISMRGTPAATTELRTVKPVAGMRGELDVALPQRSGAWRIVHGGWMIDGRVSESPPGIRVVTPAGSVLVPAAGLHATGGAVNLVLGAGGAARLGNEPGSVQVPAPPSGQAPLEFWTQRGSGARFDLRHLVLT